MRIPLPFRWEMRVDVNRRLTDAELRQVEAALEGWAAVGRGTAGVGITATPMPTTTNSYQCQCRFCVGDRV